LIFCVLLHQHQTVGLDGEHNQIALIRADGTVAGDGRLVKSVGIQMSVLKIFLVEKRVVACNLAAVVVLDPLLLVCLTCYNSDLGFVSASVAQKH
jgi:hypothetical protein